MATRQKTQKSGSKTTARSSRGRRSEKAGMSGRAGGTRNTRRERAGTGSTMSRGEAGTDRRSAPSTGEEAAGGNRWNLERRGAQGAEGELRTG